MEMTIMKRTRCWRLIGLLLVVLLLVGCGRGWTLPVSWHGQDVGAIDQRMWRQWAEAYPGDVREEDALLLERALYELGIVAVEAMTIDGEVYAWSDVAEATWLRADRAQGGGAQIDLGGDIRSIDRLELTAPQEAMVATASVIDVAPTIAHALGLPAPSSASGASLLTGSYAATQAERAVFIFLDGLGYRHYQAVRGDGVTPFLDSLGQPHLALTVYPSITRAASAVFLTGAPPAVNGVRDRSTRDTAVETLLDVIAANGLTSIAVEGEGLSFNLRNTEVILSGDRDGDGHTDDNTFENAIAVIFERMPDFLWVHFHGIDDQGHSYGPDSVQVEEKLIEIDDHVRDIVDALPRGTLVVIASDHGMRRVSEGERRGNHGTLAPEDVLVPIWVLTR
jgi:hypothetical protein